MYSVVLMMALTSGGDVPALGHGCCGGCWGCSGCYGGCHGGKHGCHGCHGCWGGCHGCHGCHGGHRKHGCCGGCYGCYGCYGGCYGGGYGCGGYGGGYGGGFGAGMPGMGVPQVAPANTAEPAPAPAQKKSTSLESAAPATLIVTVPADARLSIDGESTTSTAAQRVFVSPALNFGREYTYTLQAEFKKNGKQVTMSKEVTIKAGEETRVRFDEASTEIVSR